MTNGERPRDYLAPPSQPADANDGAVVTPSDRAAVVDGLCAFAESHGIDRDAVAAAMGVAALPGVDLEALDDVRFQLEYAVRDDYFVALRPCAVAIAAVLNCLDELWGEDLERMLRAFPAVAKDDFPPLAEVRAAKERLWVEMERGHACEA